MPDKTALAKRMKDNYELRARHYLTRRTPVIMRLDGRAFHTYTAQCTTPFDPRIRQCMSRAAQAVAEDMQGCKLVYIQSDEASFVLTDYDTLETEAWFGYCQNKMESVAASVMTAHFNQLATLYDLHGVATFDARAFNIPPEEVVNYFLWRAKDWSRNSVSLYARMFFSHNELLNKSCPMMHEMLHGIGKNWTTDLTPVERNGVFLARHKSGWAVLQTIEPTYDKIGDLWDLVWDELTTEDSVV